MEFYIHLTLWDCDKTYGAWLNFRNTVVVIHIFVLWHFDQIPGHGFSLRGVTITGTGHTTQ